MHKYTQTRLETLQREREREEGKERREKAQDLVVVVREGRATHEQLEDEAAQRPVVRGLVVALGQHQLGRQVPVPWYRGESRLQGSPTL